LGGVGEWAHFGCTHLVSNFATVGKGTDEE
jgi:hypothetical protein